MGHASLPSSPSPQTFACARVGIRYPLSLKLIVTVVETSTGVPSSDTACSDAETGTAWPHSQPRISRNHVHASYRATLRDKDFGNYPALHPFKPRILGINRNTRGDEAPFHLGGSHLIAPAELIEASSFLAGHERTAPSGRAAVIKLPPGGAGSIEGIETAWTPSKIVPAAAREPGGECLGPK